MTPVDDAVEAVGRGELIVFPTDTVYGIGARPDRPDATARLFEAKGRPPDLTIPVLVADREAADRVAIFDERAEGVVAAGWPGALTIVLPRAEASLGWDLGGEADTVGVRIPRHPLAYAVLASAGPLAVTSANRSGQRPATTCDELESIFADRVAVYLCLDEPLRSEASTVVDLAHGPARLLRLGGVPAEELSRLLGEEEPLLDSRPPA